MDNVIRTAVRTPTIPTATWTKISAAKPTSRRGLWIWNEDAANTYRVAFVRPNAAAPTAATDGMPLRAKATGDVAGGTLEELEHITVADIYAYQASGGSLETLHIQEAV